MDTQLEVLNKIIAIVERVTLVLDASEKMLLEGMEDEPFLAPRRDDRIGH